MLNDNAAEMWSLLSDQERAAILAARQAPAPSLLEKAASFATAVVAHVAAGCPTLPPASVEARLAVCQTCPSHAAGTCSLCGCRLATKASWADQDCPEGRWPRNPTDLPGINPDVPIPVPLLLGAGSL